MVCTNRESRLLMFILSKGWYERFLLTRHYKTWGGIKWLPCNYPVDFPRSVPVSAAPPSKRLSHKQGFCCSTRLSAQPFVVHCIVLFFGWFFSRIFCSKHFHWLPSIVEAFAVVTTPTNWLLLEWNTGQIACQAWAWRLGESQKNRVAEKPTWPTLWNI